MYRSQALARSSLDSSKLRELLGISNLPNYYSESSVTVMPMESYFSGSPLKNANQEMKILGNNTDQRYFMVCNFCLWCASCTNAHFSLAANNNACPSCNEGIIECLPIAKDEHYEYNLSSTGGIELKFSNRRAGEGRT
ncbi:MAG TPA: hypothetical protein VH415_06460 [Nitrososphaeraceae archaeon]